MPIEPTTRTALHRVAVHIVARSRLEATGRFSLRVTPGGLGTPEFGSVGTRVRISGPNLVVERDPSGAASVRTVPIAGVSLRSLAELAGVDLAAALDVGHDTPPLGDIDELIQVTDSSVVEVCAWFGAAAAMLDLTAAALPATAAPTLARLWPEHFDVAIEAGSGSGVRVNLGVSPGDGFCDEPYLYVGPWTADRPGDASFWNAPFGAFRRRSELGDDTAASGAAFLLEGFARLG